MTALIRGPQSPDVLRLLCISDHLAGSSCLRAHISRLRRKIDMDIVLVNGCYDLSPRVDFSSISSDNPHE